MTIPTPPARKATAHRATRLTMKTSDNLLLPRTSRRRPPRLDKHVARSLSPPVVRRPDLTKELDREDTFWTGYVRLLIFVIILTFVLTIAVSL
jgi:hypothetical protein